jgi:putative SOS response-associated peptidase YedK
MCFYYSITKKSTNKLIKGKIIRDDQLSLFDEQYIVSGFEHPFMPVITDEHPDQIQHFRWGFLPSSVQNEEQATEFLNKYSTLNAKIEDISGSKLYAPAFHQRRCLVLCSGFFEWQTVKKEKIPYFISLKDDEMFVFAGIWNRSIDSHGKEYFTYSILTVEANELMAEIHNSKKRMPLILKPETALKWIQPDLNEEELKKLIVPLPASEMKAHTIKKFVPSNSKLINNSDIIAFYNYPGIGEALSQKGLLF